MTEIRHHFVQAGHTALLSTYESLASAAEKYAAAVQKAEKQVVASNRQVIRSTKQTISREKEAPIGRETDELAKRVKKDQDAQLSRLKRNVREEIRLGAAAGKARAREQEGFRKATEKAFAADTKAHERRIAQARKLGEREGRERVRGMSSVPQNDATKSLNRGTMGMGVLSSLAGGAIGIGAAAIAGTTALVGAAAKDAMRLQEQANRISINARLSGKDYVDPTQLRKEFEQTAINTPGIKSVDVAEAVQAYITRTGDVKTARANQGTFATISSATGADIREVAGAAAELAQKFDISSIDEMREAMAALTYQGKEGAFELADAAERFPKMAAAASAFGFTKGAKGLRTLGGLSQIAQSATGESRVTATAVEAMLRQFVSQADKIKTMTGGKVNVFKDKGRTQTNDIQSLIVDTISGVGGNLTKIQDIFGDEGKKALLPLIATFNEAQKAAGPKATQKERVEAGKTAIRTQLSKAIDAPGSWADVQQDAGRAQESASAKMDAAWEKLQAVVGSRLVPVLTDMATRLADSTELFDALAIALNALIDFFEYIGLVKRKDRTTNTVREESEKKIDRAEQEAAVLRAIPEEKRTRAENDRLTYTTAQKLVAYDEIARADKMDEAIAGTATPQEFAALYTGLGRNTDKNHKAFAKQLAERVFASEGMEAGEGLKGDENEEQRVFRMGVMQRERKISRREGVQETATGAGLDNALNELIAAIKKASGQVGGAVGGKPASVAP